MPRGGARPGAGRKPMTPGKGGGRAPRFQLTFEPELLAAVDTARARLNNGISRSDFMRRSIERALERGAAGVAPRLALPPEGAGEAQPLPMRMAPALRSRLEAAAGGEFGALTRYVRGAALDLAAEVLGHVGAAAAGKR